MPSSSAAAAKWSHRGSATPCTCGGGTACRRCRRSGCSAALDVPAGPDHPRLRLPLVARRRRPVRRTAAAGVGASRRRQPARTGCAGCTAGSDSVRWFGAIATLAGRVVEAGAVVPTLTIPGCRRSPSSPRPAGRRSSGPPSTTLPRLAGRGDAADLPARLRSTTSPVRRRPRVEHDLRALRRQHGTRGRLQRAAWEPGVPAGPLGGDGGRPQSCSAPSPVRTPACRRPAPCRSTLLGRVAEHLRRFASGPAANRSSSAASASSCPTTSGPVGRRPRARRRGRPWAVVQRRRRVGRQPARRRGRRRTAAPGRCSKSMVGELAATVAANVDVLGAARRGRRASRAVELDVDAAEEFLDQAPGRARAARHRADRTGAPRARRRRRARSGRRRPRRATASAGLNRETIVQWTFTAADDDGPAAISAAELARAEQTGASLLHVGQRWVRIDPAALRKVRARHDAYLRRIEELDGRRRDGDVDPLALAAPRRRGGRGGRRPRHRRRLDPAPSTASASRRRGRGCCSADCPTPTLAEEVEPPSFAGELRPYQRRGLSWLRFLDRLGLGGCLADDMGLGKTATTLAHLVDRPGPAPRRLSAVRRAQLGDRGPPLHADDLASRCTTAPSATRANDDDRRPSRPPLSPPATSSSPPTACSPATSTSSPPSTGRRSCSTKRSSSRTRPPGRLAPCASCARGQRIALTGTPVENRLSELWAILDWVNPGMLGSRETLPPPLLQADRARRRR